MTALMLPVQSGMTEVARELLEEVERHSSADLAACCERLGIERMTWHLAVLPSRDYLVIHVQGPESALVLSRLTASRHPFDRWLYAGLTEITGLDVAPSEVIQWLLPLADMGQTRATEA